MVRNLRESIPKTTGFFYINSIKESLRFYLLNELTKEFSYGEVNYLEEDPEVANKRNYYLSIMKVLKNCEKIIQYDEEYNNFLIYSLKFAIRGDNNKSIEKILENNLRKSLTINQQENSTQHTEKSTENVKQPLREENKISVETNKSQNNASNRGSSSNTNIPKINNPVKEEEVKKKQQEKEKGNDNSISIKIDPNAKDLKDVKVNVNMDAESAYKFYQNNKQHLPTGSQVLSAAKATAEFAEKANNNLNNEPNLVTGNKPQTKKTTDPLSSSSGGGLFSSLFGTKSTTSSNQPKKQF